jgi:hypothetical protein
MIRLSQITLNGSKKRKLDEYDETDEEMETDNENKNKHNIEVFE